MDIPDINVWLALVDQNHTHYAEAARYWNELSHSELAFTRVSMLGLLRLSTQPRVLSRTLTASEAWLIYDQFAALPHVRFLSEPIGLDARFQAFTKASATFSRHLWTDAYLAALASVSGCRLVSFDTDFARFPGLDFLHLVALEQP